MVHHEKFIELIGQIAEPSQIAHGHFERDVFADRHHVVIHQRAHGVFRIRERGLQTRAFLRVERSQQFLDHVVRQILRDVRDFVGVKRFGGGQQLGVVHARDQRFAHRVRHFEQNFAVASGAHLLPHQQPVFERQRFQNVSDVGRVQGIEPVFQLGQILLVHQIFDQLLTRTALLMDELFHQPHFVEQCLHLLQAGFKRFLRLVFERVGHGSILLAGVDHTLLNPRIVTREAPISAVFATRTYSARWY